MFYIFLFYIGIFLLDESSSIGNLTALFFLSISYSWAVKLLNIYCGSPVCPYLPSAFLTHALLDLFVCFGSLSCLDEWSRVRWTVRGFSLWGWWFLYWMPWVGDLLTTVAVGAGVTIMDFRSSLFLFMMLLLRTFFWGLRLRLGLWECFNGKDLYSPCRIRSRLSM